jgi:hypothetical protein
MSRAFLKAEESGANDDEFKTAKKGTAPKAGCRSALTGGCTDTVLPLPLSPSSKVGSSVRDGPSILEAEESGSSTDDEFAKTMKREQRQKQVGCLALIAYTRPCRLPSKSPVRLDQKEFGDKRK